LQTIFGIFPNSESINYFAQKHITKSLPINKDVFLQKQREALTQHEIFGMYGQRDGAVVYEIGCGWHLATALVLGSYKCYSKIIALDIIDHVRVELVNANLHHLRDDGSLPPDFADFTNKKDLRERLLSQLNIDLVAPRDAVNTEMPDNSVDFIYSLLVFEHISPEVIPLIMKESFRILKPQGFISLTIHYSDHYYTVDKSITEYNFLKYSEKEWKKYNPKLHYVNRLRHSDFMSVFRELGFEVIEEITDRHENWEEIFKDFPFSDEFTKKYTPDDLSITSAYIVLKKT